MRIIKQILSKCIKFQVLNNINYLEYTPSSIEQIILGSNGSGKSSLLLELIRLVPDGEDFEQDGYKETHIEHNGSTYILRSSFRNRAGEHLFLKDGVDLNESGRQVNQRDLVQSEFGITPNIERLITGKIRFTRMTSAQRREWLMDISGTDFTFALKLHKHFERGARDLKGHLAQLDETIVAHHRDIQELTTDHENRLKRAEQIKKELLSLLRVLPSQGTVESATRHRSRVIDKLNEYTTTIGLLADEIDPARVIGSIPSVVEGRSLPFVRQGLLDLEDDLRGQQQKIKLYTESIESLPQLTEASEGGSQEVEAELKAQLKNFSEGLSEALSVPCSFAHEQGTADTRLRMVDNLLEPLTEVCNTARINDQGQYSRERWHELNNEDARLGDLLLRLQNHASKVSAAIEHAEHTDMVDCPECKASFKPGIDPKTLESNKRVLDETNARYEKTKLERENLAGTIDDFRQYRDNLVQFRQFVSGFSELSPFWDRVIKEELFQLAPRKIPILLARYREDLMVHSRIDVLTTKVEELTFKVNALDASGGAAFIAARRSDYEAKLFEAQREANELRKKIGAYGDWIAQCETYSKMGDDLKVALREYEGVIEEAIKALEVEELQKVAGEHQSELASLDASIGQYTVLKGVVETLIRNREEAAVKHSHWEVIAKSLSPRTGLIAEAIKGFINHFTAMLNEHIGQVWNYGMEIQALIEDGAKFDCKFPIRIATFGATVPDIEDSSAGMASMIDFAFMLVVLRLKNIHNFPLLVDEFGKDFDNEHRERLVQYIKALMEQDLFSQMFMVSHYASVYGAFNNAEFLVLCDRNITVPEVYNQHVVMK